MRRRSWSKRCSTHFGGMLVVVPSTYGVYDDDEKEGGMDGSLEFASYQRVFSNPGKVCDPRS
jgi:hypothetical protein